MMAMEKKGKILIVDDNEDVLLSLNMLLKPYVEGIRVINTPERIIGMMDSFRPDVIMLDMNFHRDAISGEEGYEWLEKILPLRHRNGSCQVELQSVGLNIQGCKRPYYE
jgi:two-component SAPR family response regulator